MRTRLWAALAAVALLAGCASIPTSGPVRPGITTDPEQQSFEFLAEGPSVGDTPQQIITGFISALPQGFDTDFQIAREYLTPGASRDWDPLESLVVFGSGDFVGAWDEDGTAVVYSVPLAATLDAHGRLVEAAVGEETTLDFSVVQDASGEWRIASLADGALIAESTFENLFREVNLVFASQDASSEVVETRWVADAFAPTRAASELVMGPSPWLSDAVLSGFSSAAALEVGTVVVTDGEALVPLVSEAAEETAGAGLGLAQMERTLTALPTVTDVQMTLGGVPVESAADVTLEPPDVPSEEAAAIVGSRLGLWNGSELRVTPDSAGAIPSRANGLAQSYSGRQTAFLVGGSRLVVTDALSGRLSSLVPSAGVGDAPDEPMPLDTLLTGSDLVSPSYDGHGWLWTAESEGGGVIALDAESGGGERADLSAEWLTARVIEALAVSRDGARLVISSTVAGQPVLEVTGIVRNDAGVPVSLTTPLQVGVSSGVAVDLAWVDSTTVAALGVSVDEGITPVWIVGVGGFTEAVSAATDTVAMTARSGLTSLTVVTGEAEALARSGTGWTPVVDGVVELAYAG